MIGELLLSTECPQELLKDMNELRIKEQFVKIQILNWHSELPKDEIQGKVTSGSESLNGSSNIRRTANLSMVADKNISNVTDIENLIAINKKVRIYLGFTIPKYLKHKYPIAEEYDKIWYPQGVFIIRQPAVNYNNGGLNISLQLDDKMSLLNGSAGGAIPAATVFDSYDEYDRQGNKVNKRVPIIDIIKQLVHEFGHEDLNRIQITDIPKQIKKVMKWTGKEDLVLIKDNFDTESGNYSYKFEIENGQIEEIRERTFSTGEDVGYIYEDFYYPSELTCNPGEAVTSILDKIKNTLGNFEYFYDIEGIFHFQEIKNYLNNNNSPVDTIGTSSWGWGPQSPEKVTKSIEPTTSGPPPKIDTLPYGIEDFNNLTEENYCYKAPSQTDFPTYYEFNDANLITSYSNTPNYNGIKNDFIIWGMKNTGNNNKIPVHYHLAFDRKPELNKHDGYYYVFLKYDEGKKLTTAYALEVGTTLMLGQEPPRLPENQTEYSDAQKKVIYVQTIDNITKAYIWNDIFNDFLVHTYTEDDYEKTPPIGVPIKIQITDWREHLYFEGLLATQNGTNSDNFYYKEMVEYWPKIWNIASIPTSPENSIPVYKGSYKLDNGYPNQFDFYIDFLEPTYKTINEDETETTHQSRFASISIPTIGRRTLAINENSVNCVFAPAIPNFVVIPINQEDTATRRNECITNGQPYIQVSEAIYNALAVGGNNNSAFEYLRSVLHQYTNYNESVAISAIPIYYFEPNNRITIKNEECHINGDYMINSISLPFDVNGTMSLNCSRAVERI